MELTKITEFIERIKKDENKYISLLLQIKEQPERFARDFKYLDDRIEMLTEAQKEMKEKIASYDQTISYLQRKGITAEQFFKNDFRV